MPRVKIKVARNDTYRKGAQIKADTKKGYRIDRSKPFDENDTLFCKKGEKYYEWVFRYGGPRRSLTHPKPSQLTQSDFLQRVYGANETLQEFDESNFDDLASYLRDEIVSELEELRDEQEEKKDNMPEGLQEGPVGELLESRRESLDEMISELENLDFEVDEDLDEEELESAKIEKIEEINQIQYEGE